MSDDEERQLKVELMQADLKLKQRQAFWENPRNLSIILAATVAIVATIAGLAGFKLGSQAPASSSVTVFQLPPGSTITTPAKP